MGNVTGWVVRSRALTAVYLYIEAELPAAAVECEYKQFGCMQPNKECSYIVIGMLFSCLNDNYFLFVTIIIIFLVEKRN